MTTMRSLPGSGKGVALHRSLYGRIAIGYLLMIAVALAAQGIVILSMVDRSARSRPPEFTPVLADELGRRLAANPGVDLQAFAASVSPGEHVFVVMKDGRVAGARRPPVEIVQTAVAELNRSRDGVLPSTWESSVYRAVAVTSGGSTVGVLGIVPQTPWERIRSGDRCHRSGVARRRHAGIRRADRRPGAAAHPGSSECGVSPRRRRSRPPARTTRASDEVADLASGFNDMADELAKREAAVTMSNRARQQLLADVSHELMTPLTAVLRSSRDADDVGSAARRRAAREACRRGAPGSAADRAAGRRPAGRGAARRRRRESGGASPCRWRRFSTMW